MLQRCPKESSGTLSYFWNLHLLCFLSAGEVESVMVGQFSIKQVRSKPEKLVLLNKSVDVQQPPQKKVSEPTFVSN